MANGGEHGVDLVTVSPLEEVAVEMAVGFHVADDRLDGRAPAQFAFDLPVHATFLTGFEYAQWLKGIVASVSLVDVHPLDLAPCEGLGFLDHGPERVAIIWVAVESLGMEHELAALAAPIGGRDRHLAAELVGFGCLALADAFGFGRMPGIELPAALALPLGADLPGLGQRDGEDRLQGRVALDLAADNAVQSA